MKEKRSQFIAAVRIVWTTLLMAVPGLLLACEGCKSSAQDNGSPNAIGNAFGISIYFMLACPILLVGGMACLTVRQMRRIERERALGAVSGR
jgi:hypothetical protein